MRPRDRAEEQQVTLMPGYVFSLQENLATFLFGPEWSESKTGVSTWVRLEDRLWFSEVWKDRAHTALTLTWIHFIVCLLCARPDGSLLPWHSHSEEHDQIN